MARKRPSPWAEFSEQRRASARKYNDLCNELGMAFKEPQQDAYEQWLTLDASISEAFVGRESVGPRTAGIADRLVKWITQPWQPQWSTATGSPEQEHLFHVEAGEIEIVCSWRSEYQATPSYISIYWRADISTPGEMWIRFTNSDTETLLAEFRLGFEMEGNAVFTSSDLGFDPATESERWAISILLKDAET